MRRRSVNAVERLAEWYTDAPKIYATRYAAKKIAKWKSGARLDPYCDA